MKTFKSIIRAIAIPFVLAAGTWYAPAVLAHGGEDHGDEAAVVQATQALAPRTEAHSDDVEMLAVHEGGELTLYLSHVKTNEPIADAQVEIESGADKALAEPAGDGSYKAAAPWLAAPGKHGLVVTIQSENITDLLEATLEVKEPAAETQSVGIAGFAPAGLLGSLGGVALVGLLALGISRRKK